MGKRIRPEDIKVISYVHVGETLVSTEELTPQQRQRMADVLKAEWMNGLFQGQAVFRPTVDADCHGPAALAMTRTGDADCRAGKAASQ